MSTDSRSPSGTSTPTPPLVAIDLSRSFDPDASLVLVGVRGTGKSTLAVIASAAFQRRVVDVDNVFQETTGHSSATYRKLHGAFEQNRRQEEVLTSVLHTYDRDSIIVCNAGSMERSGQSLLRHYATTHPIVHIVRDPKSIHTYLKIREESKLTNLLAISGPIFRGCSNYEFYNFSETPSNHSQPSVQANDTPGGLVSIHKYTPPFLALKRAERHFLKFVALIIAKGKIPSLEPAYPLSLVPTELRRFTCAIAVPFSKLITDELEIEDLEIGIDAFEVVIDDLQRTTRTVMTSSSAQELTPARADQISRTLSTVRRTVIVPVIFHVHADSEVSASHRSTYLEHVRHGLRLAPEYCTINLALDDETIFHILSTKGSTKMIGHRNSPDYDAPDWSDRFWIDNYERARRLGCDLVRFTRSAHSLDDNFSIPLLKEKCKALAKPTIPLIAYNTGHLGRISICFNETFTNVTHESLKQSSKDHSSSLTLSGPHITAQDATRALYASFVFDPMQMYIIGASAGYSLSPAMHNAAFKVCGLPHNYQIHQTPSLNSLKSLVNNPNFGGASVSLPFKIEVISLTHSLSRHARAIGAVNTLIPVRNLNPDGSIPDDLSLFNERCRAGPVKALYGDNTDWIGIRSCIRRGLSPANAVRPRTTALIIGAGGMGRAAAYAMLHLEVKNIVIFNRTVTNAENLVAHFNRLVSSSDAVLLPTSKSPETQTLFRIIKSRDEPWPEDLRYPTIIVSCIPTHRLGNSPAPNFSLPPQWIRSPTGGVFVELAYKSLHTPLLQQFRDEAHKGWVCMDGLDLLPEQGFAQFELFTGRRAPRRLMREVVLRRFTDAEGDTDSDVIQTRLEGIDHQDS
jgi:shikimate 5-dehydrogenase/shikimate kinase/3-dehydroquinate dehydratase